MPSGDDSCHATIRKRSRRVPSTHIHPDVGTKLTPVNVQSAENVSEQVAVTRREDVHKKKSKEQQTKNPSIDG